MSRIFLNKQIHNSVPEDTVKLLYGIKVNQEFLDNLLPLWRLFGKQINGRIQKKELIAYLKNIFKFFIPKLDGFLEKLAFDECHRLLNNEEDLVSYEVFAEVFASLAYKWVENIDIQAACLFLKLIYERTTSYFASDAQGNQKQNVSYKIAVKMHPKSQIESSLPHEIRKKLLNQNIIYYEETVVYDKAQEETLRNDNFKILQRSYTDSSIIPLGFSAECLFTKLTNYGKLKQSQEFSLDWCGYNGVQIVSQIDDNCASEYFLVNKSATDQINIIPILGGKGAPYLSHYRLNPVASRPLFFEEHKTIEGEKIMFNVLSEFFTDETCRIDQINKLTQAQNEKKKRKDQAAEDQQPRHPKKRPTDLSELARNLNYELIKNVQQFSDPVYRQSTLNQIKIKLEAQDPVKKLDFKQFASKYHHLPFDNEDPWNLDIIDYASKRPLQLLILGKPKTGKTTFCREFAKRADIVHIEFQLLVEKAFIRAKEFEPENDEEGNPINSLAQVDKDVQSFLLSGQAIPPETLLELLNLELAQDLTKTNGFILDIPLSTGSKSEFNWVEAIVSYKVKLPRIQCRYFSHIVEFQQSDEEVLNFQSRVMENPDTVRLYSHYDRLELKKPRKVINEDGEEVDEELDEEQAELRKPQEESDLVFRANEDVTVIKKRLHQFNTYTKARILEFHQHLTTNEYIQIKSSGFNVNELVDQVSQSLIDELTPLRPLAIKLDGGSEKEQLTIGLEEQKISRQWSPWQQCDPVELFDKKVVQGSAGSACEYAGRVFLFKEEGEDKNLKLFMKNPRKYLQQKPQLPSTYNVAILGARRAGKKTIAAKLAEIYGWKLVDIEQIVAECINRQKQFPAHIPSNFDPKVNDIHLSEPEWKDFLKGVPLKANDVWPIVFHKLGVPLQRKPEGWGVEKKDDGEEDEEEKKKREEEEKKKAAKKGAKKPAVVAKVEGDDERPKTPPVEDLPLKEIIQQLNKDNKIEPQRGLLIVGQPYNEEQINALKYHNIVIDKFIILTDKDEEEVGKTLLKRPGYVENVILEQDLALVAAASAQLKENFGEENVKEIGIEGTIDQVLNRVRTQLDPFYIRADDESLIRVQADVNPEEDDPIPWGEYGPYCPTTLIQDGWLVPGKKDVEGYFQGKRHTFYGEKEQQFFKDNITHFYQTPFKKVEIPQPRIMLVGVRGSGVHTQLQKLYERYKLPVLDFKQNLLDLLQNERDKRKTDRRLNKGFKPPEIGEDGVEIEDPEIANEAEDFDKAAHELEMVKQLYKNAQGLFINGNFFDVDEEKEVGTQFYDLLVNSKRLPEVILYLKVNEAQFLKRVYKEREVEEAWQETIAKLKAEKTAARQLQRQEFEGKEEGETYPEELSPEFDEVEEEDWPKLEDRKTEKIEQLKAQRNADQEKLDNLKVQFDELGIKVVDIECERSIESINDKIRYELTEILQERQNLIEKHQVWEYWSPAPVEGGQEEEEKPDRLPYFEKSYNYKKSRFHDRSPLTLLDVPRNKQFPVLYRNRIYYLESKEQVQEVRRRPLEYLTGATTFPIDVNTKPQIFIIGASHSGKSGLAKLLEKKLGIVRIKISSILEEFITEHHNLNSKKALEYLQTGSTVPDDLLADLIQARVQMQDCRENGYLLDGFPLTRNQAEQLSQRGIVPFCVFSIQLDAVSILQRSLSKGLDRFGYNAKILHKKLVQQQKDIPNTENYYLENFSDNIRFLSGHISKWGLYDQAYKAIVNAIQQRQNFARSVITHQPVCVGSLPLTSDQVLANLSDFQNYSPVGLKTKRLFVLNYLKTPYLVYYDKYLYVLSSEQEVEDFVRRPDLYIYQKIGNMDLALPVSLDKTIEKWKHVEHKGHCVGNLLAQKLENGLPDLQCEYRGKVFVFSSAKYFNQFIQNPSRYWNCKLQDKLPVQFDPKNLVKKVAKKGDCTSYLEHHLGEIMMRVLAKLGYKRLKYPTINCKETALKFIAISLKASNPNKDEQYRKKYEQKLSLFLHHCNYQQEIREADRKRKAADDWNEWDQEYLLKVTAEFSQFMKEINNSEKDNYF